jgi:hypothetical protein
VRTLISPAALILALAGCGKASHQPAAQETGPAGNASGSAAARTGAGAFPQAGAYDIVRDIAGRREESRMWVDASDPQAFEAMVGRAGGSNCRDRQVSVSSGAFNVRMTCDAPDGDIHNIVIQRQGHYTATSIDITTDTILWGHPIRETEMYRLRRS